MKEIPWFNRPWSKLRRNGVSSLDDAELLSVIFTRGNIKENAVEIANKLINKYNLNKFSYCSMKELGSILKDETKVYQVLSLGELFKRYSKLKKKGYNNRIESSRDVYNIFVDQLSHENKEYLYALMLDSKNNIIRKKLISIGTVNESLIHPREIFYEAIKESCCSIILVHNHPHGDCSPSEQDKIVTNKIREAGDIMDIKLIDHVIISEGDYYSFDEQGELL